MVETIYVANTQYFVFKCTTANTKPICMSEGKPFTRKSFEAVLWFPPLCSPQHRFSSPERIKSRGRTPVSVFQPPTVTAFIGDLRAEILSQPSTDLQLCTRSLFPNTSEAEIAQKAAQCPESHLDLTRVFLW